MRKPRISPEIKPTLNMAAVQASYWFACAFTPYSTVYLQRNGFGAPQIGILNAACSVTAIFAMVAWGLVSDRINSIKKTLLLCTAGGAATFALVPAFPPALPGWTTLIFFYFPLSNVFRGCSAMLLDNLSIRLCARERINYGPVRALGSFSFMVGSLLTVPLLTKLGVAASFWLNGLTTVPALVFLARCSDPKVPEDERSEKKRKPDPRGLFRNSYYIAFLVFTVAIFIPYSAESAFLPYLMEDVGVSSTQYGTLLAVRATMEIPFLLFIRKLRRRFRLSRLIMLSGVFMAAECFVQSLFTHGLGTLLVFGSVFGLGYGIFLGTAPQYLLRLAPDHLKATAQSLYASVSAVSGIVGNFAGGFLCQALRPRPFYLLLGALFLFAIGVFAASFLFARGRYNPADEKG